MSYTLITGASKGIGRAMALEAASRKMNLVLVARTEKLLEQVADKARTHGVAVHTITADLLEDNAPQKVFDFIKEQDLKVTMLVNNAGIGHMGAFDKIHLDKHIQTMHLNMDAMIRFAYLFLKNTEDKGRRYILNTVSTGAFQPIPYLNIYSASKAFMLSFSYALRHELKAKNVHVTALCPGGTETDFFDPAGMADVVKRNAKFIMKPETVAKEGINGVLKNKAVVVPGFVNKLQEVVVKLAPKSMVVPSAGRIYEE